MNKSNKTIWIICAILFLIGLIFSICRIVQVNRKYPQRVEKDIVKGSYCEVKPQIGMTVIGSRWLDGNALKKEYGDVWYAENYMEYKAVEVSVEFVNNSNKDKKLDLFKIYIESEKYDWNGIEADLFMAKNNIPLEVKIKAGEKKKYVLPYVCLKENYLDSDWNDLSKANYYLVKKRYPVKTKWRIA